MNVIDWRAELSSQKIPPFFRGIWIILLVLTSSGCTRINEICQVGWTGTNFGLLPLFIETLAVGFILAFVVSAVFYLLLIRPKLRNWNLADLQIAPKPSLSLSFPIILIILLVVLSGLFYGADCSDTQKSVHISGSVLGISAGFIAGLVICRNMVTKPFAKIKSKKNQE